MRNNNPTVLVGNDPGAHGTSESRPLVRSKGGEVIIQAFMKVFAESHPEATDYLAHTISLDVNQQKAVGPASVKRDSRQLTRRLCQIAKESYKKVPRALTKVLGYGLYADMLVLL